MSEKKEKVDCYSCQFRGNVAGSAHSKCMHPSTKKLLDDPRLQLLAIFGSVGRTPPLTIVPKELNIKADSHGVKMGWFNFPFNFDPVWLRNCDGYKPKKDGGLESGS